MTSSDDNEEKFISNKPDRASKQSSKKYTVKPKSSISNDLPMM